MFTFVSLSSQFRAMFFLSRMWGRKGHFMQAVQNWCVQRNLVMQEHAAQAEGQVPEVVDQAARGGLVEVGKGHGSL